jgi:hypothetical protein
MRHGLPYRRKRIGEGDNLREPDVERAEAAYRDALVLADALGMRPIQRHCQLGLGGLYQRVDRPAQAKAELTAVAAPFRSLGMTFWAIRAEAMLATIGRRARV